MIDHAKIGLYKHQIDAVESAKKYLESNDPEFSHLLKLPTGSGKTGIVAVLTRIIFEKKNFLIIVPSISLKTQFQDDIESKFWNDINFTEHDKLSKHKIIIAVPEDIEKKLDSIGANENYVLITVINTLHYLNKHSDPNFERLNKEIDFIIFDEGHKEPAFSWAKTVRKLKKPTLLLSATPVRNDFRLFNVNKDNFYFYTHRLAIADKTIRDIDFQLLDYKSSDIKSFSEAIYSVYIKAAKEFEKEGDNKIRMIVRCKSANKILQIKDLLSNKGLECAAFFNSFNAKGNHQYNCFSRKIKELDYKVYIHENILIEGVDDNKINILAIYDDFVNDRELIQQIGRVLRNQKQKKSKNSIVISKNPGELKRIWENYIEFDSNQEKKLFDVKDIISINPEINWIYWDSHFRNVKGFKSEEINYDRIQVPKRVSIRKVSKSFTYNDYIEEVESDIEAKGFIINDIKDYKNNEILIIPFYKINISPFYPENTLFDNKYGIFLSILINNYIFTLNTEGFLPRYLYQKSEPISKSKSLQLLNSDSRLTKVNLKNSDLGKYSLRSKNLSAYSLNNIPPTLNDHLFVFNNVEGSIKNLDKSLQKRYLGLNRGNVSDYSNDYIPFNEYMNWIHSIYNDLNSKKSSNSYFDRYAIPIDPPVDTTPTNILFDLTVEEIVYFKNIESNNKIKNIDELALEIKNGQFDLEIEFGRKKSIYKLFIEFDTDKNKYVISSENNELETSVIHETEEIDLISYLNFHQSFRITTAGNAAFYTQGEFYLPKIDLVRKNVDLDILSLFVKIEDLEKIKSEKGDIVNLPPSTMKWHEKTLFGIISRGGNGNYISKDKLKEELNFTHLVCDDLGKEKADFIGISKNKDINEITLIHAKGNSKKDLIKLSASAFQEVCGQAVKNLDILSPFLEREPKQNITSWDGEWTHEKIGTVNKRMIKGAKTGQEFWNLYKSLILKPSTRKQVFIFTGGIFSKDELVKELKKKNISELKPEVIQIVYIIRSTWASVSSVGAELKIFCY